MPVRARGFMLPIAMLALVLLGGIVLAYFNYSAHSRATAFRFEERECVRHLAQMAVDEALVRFAAKTANPGSPESRWLMGNDLSPLTLAVPLAAAEAQGNTRFAGVLKVVTQVTKVDDRRVTRGGTPLYPGERLGTVEFATVAELHGPDGRKKVGCTCRRHHEYKIAAVATVPEPRGERTRYSPAFVLDYALLVRYGLAEFRNEGGASLNHAAASLVIEQPADASRRGRVYFGDTPGALLGADPVFLNIDEAMAALIPPAPAPVTLNKQECLLLLPDLQQAAQYLDGLEATIDFAREPMVKAAPTPGALVTRVKQDLLSMAGYGGPQRNDQPGIKILGADGARAADPGLAAAVLAGTIRQRFLHLATCRFDFSKTAIARDPNGAQILQKIEATELPCRPPIPGDSAIVSAFCRGLQQVAQQRGQPWLLSSLDASQPYRGGLGPQATASAGFGLPSFFNSRGQSISVNSSGDAGFNPYDHWDVWTKGLPSAAALARLGIVDDREGTLNLRGIVFAGNGTLNIGDPRQTGGGRPYRIRGRGVILAHDIAINTSLVKETADDLCVLVAYPGNITVMAAGPVEAALVANNDNQSGRLVVKKPLDVLGGVVVDKLDLHRWSPGKHVIRYDPGFRPAAEVLAITLAPVPVFQRLVESD